MRNRYELGVVNSRNEFDHAPLAVVKGGCRDAHILLLGHRAWSVKVGVGLAGWWREAELRRVLDATPAGFGAITLTGVVVVERAFWALSRTTPPRVLS